MAPPSAPPKLPPTQLGQPDLPTMSRPASPLTELTPGAGPLALIQGEAPWFVVSLLVGCGVVLCATAALLVALFAFDGTGGGRRPTASAPAGEQQPPPPEHHPKHRRTIKPRVNPGTPVKKEQPPEWHDVAKGPLRAKGLEVRVSQVMLIRPTLVGGRITADSSTPSLMVGVEVRNRSETRPVTYLTWSPRYELLRPKPTTYQAVLTDNFKNKYLNYCRETDDGEMTGILKDRRIPPGEKALDVLYFEKPIDNAETLHLELPLEAVGEAGSLKFLIARKRIRWAPDKTLSQLEKEREEEAKHKEEAETTELWREEKEQARSNGKPKPREVVTYTPKTAYEAGETTLGELVRVKGEAEVKTARGWLVLTFSADGKKAVLASVEDDQAGAMKGKAKDGDRWRVTIEGAVAGAGSSGVSIKDAKVIKAERNSPDED
jgi:hypothetical protein